MEHLKCENKTNGAVAIEGPTTGHHEWTGGPFVESCILLQIASTVQSFPSVI